ncbi:MAG TPA: glycosyltransferase family 39 protein [Caldilineaceae bacterium]|nr:glycosyltransferase family 39 protein [Caldilineaceae bacterium]
MLLGGGLRLAALADKSLWMDEAFSVRAAQYPLPALWELLARIDHHPPLYYALLHGWMALFGDGEAAARSFSALAATLAIPLFYGAARRLAGPKVALVAGLTLAVAPFHVRYAQEARMYALLLLAAAGALYATVAMLCERSEPARRPPLRLWLGLVVAQSAAMWSHNAAAVLLPLALNGGVGVPWFMGRARPAWQTLPGLRRPGFGRRWLAAQAMALLLWAPWAGSFLHQAQVVDREFWVQAPGAKGVYFLFRLFAVGDLPEWTGPGAVGVGLLLALAALGAWRWRQQADRLWLLLSLAMVPPLVELAVSLRRPIFHPPSLIWASLPLYLLAAVGWWALLEGRLPARMPRPASRRLAALAGATLALLWALGLYGYFARFEKEPWDLAAATVAAKAQPGDLVLFNAPWSQLPFDYYLPDRTLPLDRHGVPAELFTWDRVAPRMSEAALPALDALVEGRSQVWLVYAHTWYTDPDGLIPQALARRFEQVEHTTAGPIQVHRYHTPAAAPPAAAVTP